MTTIETSGNFMPTKDVVCPVRVRSRKIAPQLQRKSVWEAARCMNCGCYSVNASDITPVLVALDAQIVTTKGIIDAANLFTTKLAVKDMLDKGQLVTAIRFPCPTAT